MIRSHDALLRHAQDFFLAELVGYYDFGDVGRVKIAPPELRPPIPPLVDIRERRRMMAGREGLGRYLELARIAFAPWELLIYSAMEKPPLGLVILRELDFGQEMVSGPLDAATWAKIGKCVRESHGHKRAG